MESTRIQNGKTERIESFFINSSGVGVTGGTPTLKIRRKSDGQFWTGTAFQVAVATVNMTEVSAANDAGKYFYSFNTAGLPDDNYFITGTLASAANSPQFNELKVGDYVNFMDKAISSILLSIPMFQQVASAGGESVWTKAEKDKALADIASILSSVTADEVKEADPLLTGIQEKIASFTTEIISNIIQELGTVSDKQAKGIEALAALIRESAASGQTANAAIHEELAAKIAEQKQLLETAKPGAILADMAYKINLMARIAVKQTPTEVLEEAQKEFADNENNPNERTGKTP